MHFSAHYNLIVKYNSLKQLLIINLWIILVHQLDLSRVYLQFEFWGNYRKDFTFV